MHRKIKLDLLYLNFDYSAKQIDLSIDNDAEQIYLENVDYFNKYGLEELFLKYNLDAEILLELDYYEKNEGNENVYQELLNNFDVDNEVEASVLFTIIELKKLIERELEKSFDNTLSKSQRKRISWGCALAIAGVVGVSVFAIISGPITGGGSLIAFLGSKALATAALIEACGDGWGEL
jgi:hypothetical protein